MKNYEKEFPHFSGVEMPTFDGFDDTSWHNDACPSFEKKMGNGLAIRLWVDHPDPQKRDGADFGNLPFRFAIDLMKNGECETTLVITDDLYALKDDIAKVEELVNEIYRNMEVKQ